MRAMNVTTHSVEPEACSTDVSSVFLDKRALKNVTDISGLVTVARLVGSVVLIILVMLGIPAPGIPAVSVRLTSLEANNQAIDGANINIAFSQRRLKNHFLT